MLAAFSAAATPLGVGLNARLSSAGLTTLLGASLLLLCPLLVLRPDPPPTAPGRPDGSDRPDIAAQWAAFRSQLKRAGDDAGPLSAFLSMHGETVN